MKFIKGYKLFTESKSDLTNGLLSRENIIRFLIIKEKQSSSQILLFDNFEVTPDYYIKATTKAGRREAYPGAGILVDDPTFVPRTITYDLLSFEDCKELYTKRYDEFRSVEDFRSVEAFKNFRMQVCYSILDYDKKENLTQAEIDTLDRIFNQSQAWNTTKQKCKTLLDKMSKYDLDDIEDRMIEYIDELWFIGGCSWKHKLWYCFYYENSWQLLTRTDNLESATKRILRDAFYNQIAKQINLDDYLKNLKAGVRVYLNGRENRDSGCVKSLYKVYEVYKKISNRFKQLFNVSKCISNWDSYMKSPSISGKNIEVDEFEFTAILK